MATIDKQSFEQIVGSLSRRIAKLEAARAGILQTGLATDRSTTPTVVKGTTVMFYAYDTKTLSIWNIDTDDWDEEVFT